jgi:hypothetical protein
MIIKIDKLKPNINPYNNPDARTLPSATNPKNPNSLMVECLMIIRYVLNNQIYTQEKAVAEISHTTDSFVNMKSLYDKSLTNKIVPIDAITDTIISKTNTTLVLKYFVRYPLNIFINLFI